MRSSVRLTSLGFLALLVVLGSASADIIHLKTGKVEGVVVKRTDTELVVETRAGKVTLKVADVVKIEPKATPFEVYREMAAKVADNDADGHFALGLWCTDHKLFREARRAFEKAIAIKPDHKSAREKLGYVLKDGKWMTRAEARKADGFVRYKGKWVTHEERENAERRKAIHAWARRLSRAISKGPMTPEAVGARITAALGDRAGKDADVALRVILHEKTKEALVAKRDRGVAARIALADAVAAQNRVEASELLRRVAIEDPSADVRAVAVKALAAQKSIDNTAYFVGLLRKFTGARYRVRGTARTRNLARRVLRRASEALGELGDARAVPTLARSMIVQFVITRSSDEIPPMSVGVGRTNVAGATVVSDAHGNQFVVPATKTSNIDFGSGGRERRPEDGLFFNEAAYQALRRLTGQDFGHDKRAWLGWWYRNRHEFED